MRCIPFLLQLLLSAATVLALPADVKSNNEVATSKGFCNGALDALCSGIRCCLPFLRSDLQKDEAFLDQYRYYNYHEKAEDLLVSTLVKTLFTDPQIVERSLFPDAPPFYKLRVRRAVKDSDEISHIFGRHGWEKGRVAQARLLKESLEQYVPKRVRDSQPLQTSIQEIITTVKGELGKESIMAKEMYEDDWNMDRRIAFTLSGKKDGIESPLEFARDMDGSAIELIHIWRKIDLEFGDGRIDKVKEQWFKHLRPDCVNTFKTLEILHKARALIRKEKTENPKKTIDDDTRLIALLKKHSNYQSNPIQVQEAVQQARDEITFLHAIYNRRLSIVREFVQARKVFPSTLNEEILDALKYTLYERDYEMLEVLLQHHSIIYANLQLLLEAAIKWNPDISESEFMAKKKEMLTFLLKNEKTGRRAVLIAIAEYQCSSHNVRFDQYDMVASVFVESGKITMADVEFYVKGICPPKRVPFSAEFDMMDEDETSPWPVTYHDGWPVTKVDLEA